MYELNFYLLLGYIMSNFEMPQIEVNKDALQYSWIKEKIDVAEESKSGLKQLYNDILADKEGNISVDIDKAVPYLLSIKDKSFSELQKEWWAWVFAVQLY